MKTLTSTAFVLGLSLWLLQGSAAQPNAARPDLPMPEVVVSGAEIAARYAREQQAFRTELNEYLHSIRARQKAELEADLANLTRAPIRLAAAADTSRG